MSDHYYTEKPVSPIKEHRFIHEIKGVRLELISVSGVFSFEEKVDKASEILIKAFSPSPAHASILDVGCGFGPVSLFLKAFYPVYAVTGVDINERAVEYARKNADANHLHVEVVKSDLFSELSDRKYGNIVTNPPLAAGKALNIRLIQQAHEHLLQGGALFLVAYHNKGGETLKKIMSTTFGNVEDVEKSGGIRVYRSYKA